MRRFLSLGGSILACLSFSGTAAAQAGPAQAAPTNPPANQNPGEGDATAPNATAPATTAPVVVLPSPFGGVTYSPPDPNAGLPSSSRTITGDQRDGFDLNQGGNRTGVVYGNPGSAGIIGRGKPVAVPDLHVVKKGDTLWDLCNTYYQNPWGWPKVWSYNPQILNPHWIYPGDQVRLRDPNAPAGGAADQSATAQGFAPNGLTRGARLLPNTVVLRDLGYLGDPKQDVWGELAGAVEDQMLLADGNRVYLLMRPGVKLEPGQTLTAFQAIRQPEAVPGARKPPGEIVAVKGTIRIDQFNPETRVARGEIVESFDIIERGVKIGPIRRRFDVVAVKPADKAVTARVLTSFHPHVYLGQNQVLFLDRGSEDGLEPGNRLFVLRQGDTWRDSLTVAAGMLKDRVELDASKPVEVETTPTKGDEKKFPREIVAELRVLRAERYSAIALVVESNREITPGDVAITIRGR